MEISEYDSPFRKDSQFTREVFENVAFATGKPPTYTIKVEQSEIIQGKLYQKELIKIFQQGIRLQWSLVSRQYTQFFYKLFTRACELGGALRGCHFRKIPTIIVPKLNGGEIQDF